MQLSPAGERALKAREGKDGKPSFVAYDDADPERVLQRGDILSGTLTAGWGHTGPDVAIGVTYTEAQCDVWFTRDVAWVARCIQENVTVPLTQGQYDALTSFVYNIGRTNFEKNFSGLKVLNAGKYSALPEHFDKWNRTTIDGKLQVSHGLVNRRNSEDGQWVQGSFVAGSKVQAEPPVPLWKTPRAKALGATLAGVTGTQLSAAATQAQMLSNTWHVFVYVFGALTILGTIVALVSRDK